MLRSSSLLAAILFLLPSVVMAGEPTEAEKNRAAELVYTGDERRAAGDHAGALRAYEEADAIVRVPTTGIEVARELAALGRLVDARDAAVKVVEHTQREGEPAAFARARRDAKQLVASLDTRIATLVVRAPRAPGAEITVDGRLITAGEPARLDPGKRVVTARVGSASAKKVVNLHEGEKRDVTIELEAADAEDPATTEPPARPSARPRDADGTDPPLRSWVWVGFGGAVAGTVVGSVTGALALSSTAGLDEECDGRVCPARLRSDIERAMVLSHVSTASFAVGAVGLAVGLTALLWPRSPKTAASARVVLGPGYAGAAGGFP
jgi:hypothetical protein